MSARQMALSSEVTAFCVKSAGVAGNAAKPVVDRVGQDLRLPGDRSGQLGEAALLLDGVLRIWDWR